MGKIYAAKTNHITNPLGFYLKPLVFSWKVKGGRGQEQKHARIVISKNKTFTDICHDTGEAELDSLSARTAAVYKILLESYCDNRCRGSDRIRHAVL